MSATAIVAREETPFRRFVSEFSESRLALFGLVVFVIIALLIGGSLLGVIGAILAVPTAAILQVLFEELMNDTAAE